MHANTLIDRELLPNNNDITTTTTTTSATTDVSVNAGSVKGFKIETNTNSKKSPQLFQQHGQSPQRQDITKSYAMLNKGVVYYRLLF